MKSNRHIVRHERGTDDPEGHTMGNLDWIRPVCTCGWKGTKWYGYHNFQDAECAREGNGHAKRARLNSYPH